MFQHKQFTDTKEGNRLLLRLIKKGEIRFAGNSKLRIYGTLQCKSGKRMNRSNRIFFASKNEALEIGFRPCGHCMRASYQEWKNKQ